MNKNINWVFLISFLKPFLSIAVTRTTIDSILACLAENPEKYEIIETLMDHWEERSKDLQVGGNISHTPFFNPRLEVTLLLLNPVILSWS